MKNNLILISILFSFLTNCNQNDIKKVNINEFSIDTNFFVPKNHKKPKNLEECYKLLDILISDSVKNEIKKSKDVSIMAEYHFTYGLNIRNF